LSQSYLERAEIAYLTYAADPKAAEFDAADRTEMLAALQQRLGLARAPDLSSTGFRLLGARVAPGVRGPAALLFYESAADARRVALYYERAEAADGSTLAPRLSRDLSAIEWRAAGYDFVLIGPPTAENLQRAAEIAAAETLAPSAPAP
jgi:anti-sigma factor RsiW